MNMPIPSMSRCSLPEYVETLHCISLSLSICGRGGVSLNLAYMPFYMLGRSYHFGVIFKSTYANGVNLSDTSPPVDP